MPASTVSGSADAFRSSMALLAVPSGSTRTPVTGAVPSQTTSIWRCCGVSANAACSSIGCPSLVTSNTMAPATGAVRGTIVTTACGRTNRMPSRAATTSTTRAAATGSQRRGGFAGASFALELPELARRPIRRRRSRRSGRSGSASAIPEPDRTTGSATAVSPGQSSLTCSRRFRNDLRRFGSYRARPRPRRVAAAVPARECPGAPRAGGGADRRCASAPRHDLRRWHP